MKFFLIVFVTTLAFSGAASAGDYCNDVRNASSDFCESVRKSEEALQKVRELLERSKSIQNEIDRQMEQKAREMQKK